MATKVSLGALAGATTFDALRRLRPRLRPWHGNRSSSDEWVTDGRVLFRRSKLVRERTLQPRLLKGAAVGVMVSGLQSERLWESTRADLVGPDSWLVTGFRPPLDDENDVECWNVSGSRRINLAAAYMRLIVGFTGAYTVRAMGPIGCVGWYTGPDELAALQMPLGNDL